MPKEYVLPNPPEKSLDRIISDLHLDITTVEGRIRLFDEWRGCDDPMVLAPIWMTPLNVDELFAHREQLLRPDRINRAKGAKVNRITIEMTLDEWVEFHRTGPMAYTNDGKWGNGYGRSIGVRRTEKRHGFFLIGPLTDAEIKTLDVQAARDRPDSAQIVLQVTRKSALAFEGVARILRALLLGQVVSYLSKDFEQHKLMLMYEKAYTALFQEVEKRFVHKRFRMPIPLAAFTYALHGCTNDLQRQVVQLLWERLVNNDELAPGEPLHHIHAICGRDIRDLVPIAEVYRVLHFIEQALAGKKTVTHRAGRGPVHLFDNQPGSEKFRREFCVARLVCATEDARGVLAAADKEVREWQTTSASSR